MSALAQLSARILPANVAARGVAFLKALGPYAAIELILPGGTLIALVLWLYSRRKSGKPLLPFRFTFSGSQLVHQTMNSLKPI